MDSFAAAMRVGTAAAHGKDPANARGDQGDAGHSLAALGLPISHPGGSLRHSTLKFTVQKRPHRGLQLLAPEGAVPVAELDGVPDIQRRDLLGGLIQEYKSAA
jgi:hypothetical protein